MAATDALAASTSAVPSAPTHTSTLLGVTYACHLDQPDSDLWFSSSHASTSQTDTSACSGNSLSERYAECLWLGEHHTGLGHFLDCIDRLHLSHELDDIVLGLCQLIKSRSAIALRHRAVADTLLKASESTDGALELEGLSKYEVDLGRRAVERVVPRSKPREAADAELGSLRERWTSIQVQILVTLSLLQIVSQEPKALETARSRMSLPSATSNAPAADMDAAKSGKEPPRKRSRKLEKAKRWRGTRPQGDMEDAFAWNSQVRRRHASEWSHDEADRAEADVLEMQGGEVLAMDHLSKRLEALVDILCLRQVASGIDTELESLINDSIDAVKPEHAGGGGGRGVLLGSSVRKLVEEDELDDAQWLCSCVQVLCVSAIAHARASDQSCTHGVVGIADDAKRSSSGIKSVAAEWRPVSRAGEGAGGAQGEAESDDKTFGGAGAGTRGGHGPASGTQRQCDLGAREGYAQRRLFTQQQRQHTRRKRGESQGAKRERLFVCCIRCQGRCVAVTVVRRLIAEQWKAAAGAVNASEGAGQPRHGRYASSLFADGQAQAGVSEPGVGIPHARRAVGTTGSDGTLRGKVAVVQCARGFESASLAIAGRALKLPNTPSGYDQFALPLCAHFSKPYSSQKSGRRLEEQLVEGCAMEMGIKGIASSHARPVAAWHRWGKACESVRIWVADIVRYCGSSPGEARRRKSVQLASHLRLWDPQLAKGSSRARRISHGQHRGWECMDAGERQAWRR
ncbi:hypothetical protein L1887_47053 [Cichorium endivia]|nr:hypothetical protein L1887_47053 [Cichorium endivia]